MGMKLKREDCNNLFFFLIFKVSLQNNKQASNQSINQSINQACKIILQKTSKKKLKY
jgi:hypothetical protein